MNPRRTHTLKTAWSQAESLRERAERTVPPDGDRERAERRWERWLSDPPFDGEESRLEERMAEEGLDTGAALRVLSGPPSHGRTPGWAERLEQLYSEATEDTVSPLVDSEPLLAPFAPILSEAMARVRRVLEEDGDTPRIAVPEVLSSLWHTFRDTLVQVTGRTMALELNVARVVGTLTEATPTERFTEFAARFRDPLLGLELLCEYPVLARIVMTRADQWVGATKELVLRLREDWPLVLRAFPSAEEAGALTSVETGRGDTHREGRSVASLTFASGFRLMYKPRSMSTDAHFRSLVTWLNERGLEPVLRAPIVLDRHTHGWQEFVHTEECQDVDALARFYRRQGALVALLYVLHAVDFHYENLIAAGEDPVLVDLESLFHSSHQNVQGRHAFVGGNSMESSVLQSGLLPRRTYLSDGDGGSGAETSGMGAAEGQVTPFAVPHWESPGTDEMSLRRGHLGLPTGDNRPAVGGTYANPVEHVDDVVAGFTDAYRLLVRHRGELLHEGGPLLCFADDEVRHIARATLSYALVLLESHHPDVLRDALDRDRLLDRLWVSTSVDAPLSRLFRAERADLEQGDVPVFTTTPARRDLYTSRGEVIPDFFREPVMDSVVRRVEGLGEEDLVRQTWFVRASFTTLVLGEGQAAWRSTTPIAPAPSAARTDDLVEEAARIGDRLELLALTGEDTVDWVGISFVNEQAWSLAPAGPDMYSGLWGIALFLAHLGHVTGQDRYTHLAERTVAHLCDKAPSSEELTASTEPGTARALGPFQPVGSACYVLTHLGHLWKRPELTQEALALGRWLSEGVAADEEHDIIGGSAGLACVLLGLTEATGSRESLDGAVACAQHLVDRARPMEVGIAWPNPRFGTRPLAGYSHGASGVADALLRTAEVSGRSRFLDAARAAFAYERTVFDPERGNWPDLREFQHGSHRTDDAGPRFMSAWCHGAPGIGLSRLTAVRVDDGPQVRDELDTAIRTTIETGFAQGHSLCHGSLGNIELLHLAGRQFDDEELLSRTARTAHGVLRSLRTDGLLCGVPNGVETPGLMAGMAGIGHGLLRLAHPDQVPSVLTLSPPPRPNRNTAPRPVADRNTTGPRRKEER